MTGETLPGGEQLSSPEKLKPIQAVAILDAGAQYGKVIDRRVRNLGVRSEILPLNTPAEELSDFDALIISGGPQSVYSPEAPAYDSAIFELEKPILGICYGMQLMNQCLGGSVERGGRREDGPAEAQVDSDSPLFDQLAAQQTVLMSHGDSIASLAPGFEASAMSGDIVAAIEDRQRHLYGVQFHPEVDITTHGSDILGNFLFNVAGLEQDYTVEDREAEAIRYIQETVGEREVLVFASGGVDSTVCTVLLGKALDPAKVHAVHIDTGFMRLGESREVAKALSSVGIELTVIDDSEHFASATTLIDGVETMPLREVTEPEIKRKIIGDTFIKVLGMATEQLGLDPDNTVLGQGTLRPDLIESASSLASTQASVIKTHHNDTPLVRELRANGQVVEPLQSLHKDEVRELGRLLGLSDELVWRQPFPGPGLAIRAICAERPFITPEFIEVGAALQEFSNEKIATTLLPIQTVGVQGDGRSYSYLAALSGESDWDRLMEMAREIPKTLHSVNRVVYVFGEQVRGPIDDITPTFPTAEVIEQLRRADDVVNKVLIKYDLVRALSQVPVVSFPVHFGKPGNRSIGIRTFITNDFMTGVPAIPGVHLPFEALDEMVYGITRDDTISRVAYDLTSKPPGTTEWE